MLIHWTPGAARRAWQHLTRHMNTELGIKYRQGLAKSLIFCRRGLAERSTSGAQRWWRAPLNTRTDTWIFINQLSGQLARHLRAEKVWIEAGIRASAKRRQIFSRSRVLSVDQTAADSRPPRIRTSTTWIVLHYLDRPQPTPSCL